ncbi:MAG: hypothetical protein NZ988_03375 [Thaumarchaeota archaeon]|nr:hypothetical protein [Candidatus Calditenuaceae archaeon]MDW8187073.1 hypothetical protein [Nitrososphaerota archaeon]
MVVDQKTVKDLIAEVQEGVRLWSALVEAGSRLDYVLSQLTEAETTLWSALNDTSLPHDLRQRLQELLVTVRNLLERVKRRLEECSEEWGDAGRNTAWKGLKRTY